MTTPYQRSALSVVASVDLAPRFWPKVNIAREDDCWEWTAFRNGRGYGMFRVIGKMELAHRVGWVLHHGPIPDEAQILHRCDNPPCVNPAHLFLGDNAVNVADKVSKGRSSVSQPKKRGEGHPLAKLSWDDVKAIRSEWSGRRGQGRRLAERYGVSPATITNVVKRKVWHDGGTGHSRAGPSSPPQGRTADGVGEGSN